MPAKPPNPLPFLSLPLPRDAAEQVSVPLETPTSPRTSVFVSSPSGPGSVVQTSASIEARRFVARAAAQPLVRIARAGEPGRVGILDSHVTAHWLARGQPRFVRRAEYAPRRVRTRKLDKKAGIGGGRRPMSQARGRMASAERCPCRSGRSGTDEATPFFNMQGAQPPPFPFRVVHSPEHVCRGRLPKWNHWSARAKLIMQKSCKRACRLASPVAGEGVERPADGGGLTREPGAAQPWIHDGRQKSNGTVGDDAARTVCSSTRPRIITRARTRSLGLEVGTQGLSAPPPPFFLHLARR